MTDNEKLSTVMTILDMDASDLREVEKVTTYLRLAGTEILNWRYSYGGTRPAEVPEEYELTQIYAVVAGYTQAGAEGQTRHTENGISRAFRHSDMLAYIRANVIPLCKVVTIG